MLTLSALGQSIASRAAVATLAAILAVAGLAFGLRLMMLRRAENTLRPGEDVAIAELRGKLPANAFLLCPPGHCAAEAEPGPVFATAADGLYRAVAQLIAGEPRVAIVIANPPHRIVAIQHSAVFGFPDIVTAEIVALGPERSAVALYSRARYGRGDFGVNRRRVEAWLAHLRRLLPAVQ